MALRSARVRGGAGFFFELVLALVARGWFFLLVKWLCAPRGPEVGRGVSNPPPYLWTPLSPQRVKGCSPLTIPKMRSKPKNASRFAKRIFLCFSHLRLRRRFYLSAELHALRGRNTCCEAANRRNEKKVQQRRPPPVAETGRSCWGSGQQDASGSEADAGSRNPS